MSKNKSKRHVSKWTFLGVKATDAQSTVQNGDD